MAGMEVGQLFKSVRNFLFGKANREFLVFLFFLAISGTFWLMMALNETYEKEIIVPVGCSGVPKNVVLTSSETDTLRLTLRDKGITLATYIFGEALHNVAVDFKSHVHSSNSVRVTSAEMQKIVSQRLAASTKIVSVKPERLEFTFNYGERRLLPVRWRGRVIPEDLYFISEVQYSPDSVVVYASGSKLDSLSVVYTEQLNYVNFHDTLTVSCQLQKMSGVKMVPEQVELKFITDVLTDATIDNIPVKGINMPEGLVLRTFPSKVSVSFITGINTLKTLSADDFEVVADYNELKASTSPECNIYLRRSPDGISKVSLVQKKVDYLIEQTPSGE